ncbi:MAG: hypothetical protein RDV48_28855 [Candidatus Eremiobacteraeota bacterium]|nr:hypothetical protein [Candidatus Eremiobacteraeota bacterium]
MDEITAISGSFRGTSPQVQTAPQEAQAPQAPGAPEADAPQGADAPGVHAAGDDQFVKSGGSKPALSQQEIARQMAERAEREKIASSMIVRDSRVGAPDEASAQDLTNTLAAVDLDMLKYNQANGTKFIIVKPGQDLMDTGVIRSQDPAAINAGASAMGKDAREALGNVEAEYGPRIKALEGKLAGLPPAPAMSIFGSASDADAEKIKERSMLEKELSDLKAQQRKKEAELVEKETKDKAMIFSPLVGSDAGAAGPMGMMIALQVSQQPMSTNDMAAAHGAKTPEEIKQFNDSVEKLNGDRLTALRQESLKNMETMTAAVQDPEQKRQFLESIDKFKKDPQSIPLDQANNPVLVPNTFYYRPEDKPDAKPSVVDAHDYGSLKSWTDGSGKIKGVDPMGSTTLGQHFYKDGMNTILIRESALKEQAPIHEMGHATESIIERKSPGFSKELTEGRDKAFSHVGFGDGRHESVTPYAGTGERENLAEGFALYYSDPKLLKAKDPELYALVEKEAAFIKSQANGAVQGK